MASLIDTLIDVLGQEDAEYKKLLELSNNKTKAIVGADIERLQDILVQEQAQIDAINKLEQQRMENVDDICNVLNLRRTDIKFGWEQPQLPYHNQEDISANLSGNVLENEKWNGTVHDYQTSCPELILTCPGYFNGEGVGTIYIPIKYCPECGRKLGKVE